jgi:ferritin-like metal-binding protein YciE
LAKMKSLEDLFINLLNDIHYAEKQTRPSCGGPSSTILRRRKDRWSASKKWFALSDTKATGKTCQSIKGILQEG